MKKNVEMFSKKYLIGIILGIFVFGIGGVYAATYIASNRITYDHSTSGMSATEVQGAIDELYNTCIAKPPTSGGTILDKIQIVTTGDGLYKDEYEDRYFYRGKNPNNYLTFNNETAGWRIISIEDDGTIKIMKIDSIGNIAWDAANFNDWSRPATLNTYLNGTYYNSLSNTAKSQIVSHDYSIGAVTRNNNDLADQINDENSKKWNGKIALPTLSEYIRTNLDTDCNTFSKLNNNHNTCKNTTWMHINPWWTLTPLAGSSDSVLYISQFSEIIPENTSINSLSTVPAVYLNSNVKITGGNGNQTNPYTLG